MSNVERLSPAHAFFETAATQAPRRRRLETRCIGRPHVTFWNSSRPCRNTLCNRKVSSEAIEAR